MVRITRDPVGIERKSRSTNPFPNGRTLLHFEGAGQKTEVFVHTEKVGSHVGGYDEFVVDITEQAKKFPKTDKEHRVCADRGHVRQLTRPRNDPVQP